MSEERKREMFLACKEIEGVLRAHGLTVEECRKVLDSVKIVQVVSFAGYEGLDPAKLVRSLLIAEAIAFAEMLDGDNPASKELRKAEAEGFARKAIEEMEGCDV